MPKVSLKHFPAFTFQQNVLSVKMRGEIQAGQLGSLISFLWSRRVALNYPAPDALRGH